LCIAAIVIITKFAESLVPKSKIESRISTYMSYFDQKFHTNQHKLARHTWLQRRKEKMQIYFLLTSNGGGGIGMCPPRSCLHLYPLGFPIVVPQHSSIVLPSILGPFALRETNPREEGE
jgi:hypothetical protein